MECPKCGQPVWDNRQKKVSGQFKANAPDFACKNKDTCGWNSYPEKGGNIGATVAQYAPSSGGHSAPTPAAYVQPPVQVPPYVPPQAPIANPGAFQAPITPGVGRDAELVALYWNCLETVMAGIALRKLTDYFKSDNVVSMTACLFIARSKPS